MDTVALAAQVVLAAVFAVAAVGKLADLPGSRRALTGFGFSDPIARVTGTLLPLVELALAVLLVLRPTAQWGAAAAFVLLLIFVGAIARAMSRGEAPDCGCFGALHSAPAGGRALARNGVLALVAIFVAARGPGPPLHDWVGDRTAAELVAIVAGMAALGLGGSFAWAWRENRRLRRDLAGAKTTIAAIPPGLPVGALAPAFEVPGEKEETTLTLESLLGRGRMVALVFVRPGCGPSEVIIAQLHRWNQAMGERLEIAVVGAGSVARYRRSEWTALTDAVAHDPGLLEENDALYALFDSYNLLATPSAVILTPEGTVASATVDGGPAIEALLRVTLARSRPAGEFIRPAAA